MWIRCLLSASLFWSGIVLSAPSMVCHLTFSNGTNLYFVPVAQTPLEKSKGLSGTKSIKQGMLFIYTKPGILVYWMKDTWYPISVGFFDESGKLVGITDMQPNSDKKYYSPKPATQGLELPKGKFKQLGIKVGARMIDKSCIKKQNSIPLSQ